MLAMASKINFDELIKETVRAEVRETLWSILGGNADPSTVAHRTKATKVAPKKRRLSAAGRAAISRAAKARWAKFHAAKRKKARNGNGAK